MTPFRTRLFRRGGRRGARARREAFTILELIIALALIIMIMVWVYQFYRATLQTREVGRQVAVDAMLARSILERMADEIRHSSDFVPGDGQGFKGKENEITIVRRRLPELNVFEEHDSMREELPPAQMDLIRIKYQLIWDEENLTEEGDPFCHGLWRTFRRTFDPRPNFVVKDDETGEEIDPEEDDLGEDAFVLDEGELIAPEIKYLRLEYFDGAKWRDRWQIPYEGPAVEGEEFEGEEGQAQLVSTTGLGGVGYALPQAVRITIGRKPVPPEDDEFGPSTGEERSDFLEDEEEELEYHPDRFSIVVHLPQADTTLLSSRKHGVENRQDLQMGGGM